MTGEFAVGPEGADRWVICHACQRPVREADAVRYRDEPVHPDCRAASIAVERTPHRPPTAIPNTSTGP